MNTLDFPTLTSPSARTTRHYTDSQKLQALNLLACCNGNLREAARTADIPWTTLRSWSQQYEDQYAAYCTKVRGDANTVDRVELPELGGLLTDLEAKADLLIAQITPERLADVPLTHVARLLTSILPRIESMRKIAAAREYARARSKTYRDIVYIIRRLVPDPILRQQIHDEFTRINSPELLEPDEDESDDTSDETSASASEIPPSPTCCASEQSDHSSDSPLPTSLSESPGEGDGHTPVTIGVRSPDNLISSPHHQTHPDRKYRHPLPYSEERAPRSHTCEPAQLAVSATGKGALTHTCGTGGLGNRVSERTSLNTMSEVSERAFVQNSVS